MLCGVCKTFPVHRVLAFFHINVSRNTVKAILWGPIHFLSNQEKSQLKGVCCFITLYALSISILHGFKFKVQTSYTKPHHKQFNFKKSWSLKTLFNPENAKKNTDK